MFFIWQTQSGTENRSQTWFVATQQLHEVILLPIALYVTGVGDGLVPAGRHWETGVQSGSDGETFTQDRGTNLPRDGGSKHSETR